MIKDAVYYSEMLSGVKDQRKECGLLLSKGEKNLRSVGSRKGLMQKYLPDCKIFVVTCRKGTQRPR